MADCSGATERPALVKDCREALRERIRAEGPLRLDRFMSFVLTDPEYGYYCRCESIGRQGDFITAPEISQMFGELIAMWCADIWLRAGKPEVMQLVELGPGRGTLMADMLGASASVAGFREALRPMLVEVSPRLRAEQRRRLAGHVVHWFESLDEVPLGAAFYIANEFFDALPIRQFVVTKDGLRERSVGIDESGALSFVLGEVGKFPRSRLTASGDAMPEGGVFEDLKAVREIAGEIGARLNIAGGAALLVDYGYTESERDRQGGFDSLQAVRGHNHAGILDAPGESDLSAHVNFSALAQAARESGVLSPPVVSQGEFLKRIGLCERARVLVRSASRERRREIADAVQRLAGAGEMGRLFRVQALIPTDWPMPCGLAANVAEEEG